MRSPCLRNKCVQCCLETEMPLLNEEIESMKGRGFSYDHFVVSRDGWLQLKNQNGRCVYNDGKGCSIYDIRPEGCRLYPIVCDEDANRATLDRDCPHRNEFRISESDLGMLISLVHRLKDERKQRR